MTYTLSNDLLTVSIQDAGAQLCSVRSAGGTEYLWQADPAVWGRHAPLLFPLIGRLQDSQYTLDGRAWSISTHGFARDAQFQVSEQGPTALSFQLEDSEETRAGVPVLLCPHRHLHTGGQPPHQGPPGGEPLRRSHAL